MKIPALDGPDFPPSHGASRAEPEDPALHEIARLCALILDVPFAVVSMVDEGRCWTAASAGLDVRTLRGDTKLCRATLAEAGPLHVRDARDDARLADSRWVTGEPRVRFFVGAALRSSDGRPIGTISAFDRAPRAATDRQLEALTLLASRVVAELEAQRARAESVRQRDTADRAAQKLEDLFDAMAEGVVLQDATGAIGSANAAAEEILGLTLAQLQGRTSLDPRWRAVREDGSPFPGDEHPAMVAIRTGESQRGVVMGIHKPDGSLTWLCVNSVARREGSRVAEVWSTFHDVTALKDATARMAQRDRLATVGTLAAGVGHEINNPLSCVIANLDFALGELEALFGQTRSTRTREVLEALGETKEGANRIRRIVHGLRALSREDVTLDRVSVASAVDAALGMAAHPLRHRATVTLGPLDLPPVLAEQSRVTQILVNLLVNAAQAFETPDPSKNRVHVDVALRGGDKLSIRVRDNGPGVPESLRRRVFDPFFTTKPVGQGTGLGLSVSRTIADSLHGELALEDTDGGGATFSLTLPLAFDAGAHADRHAFARAPRGRVLVVDDDPAVLGGLQRILGREHEVVASSDPRQALELLVAGEDFDLVLCDLAMPHLDGEALFGRAQMVRPELSDRFVFLSGATQPGTQAFLWRIPNEQMTKPFATSDLVALARRFVHKARDPRLEAHRAARSRSEARAPSTPRCTTH